MQTEIEIRQRVQMAVDTMRAEALERGRRDKIVDDLRGLRSEIYRALGMAWWTFAVYERLLSQEAYLWDPVDVYRFGRACAERGMSCKQGRWACLSGLSRKPATENYYRALQGSYSRVSSALRCVRAGGLLSEYTEAYRGVYGAVHHNADLFFRMGYKDRLENNRGDIS